MQVKSIPIHPPKSSKGIPVETIKIQPTGMENDRCILVTNTKGKVVRVREHHKLIHL